MNFIMYSITNMTKFLRGGMKLKPPFFLSRNSNCNYNGICIYHGQILYKVEITFPQCLLHYQHSFTTFVRVTVRRSNKNFAETLFGLSTMSFSLILKQCTQHLIEAMSMASSPNMLLRWLWISIRLEPSAVWNSTATLCLVCRYTTGAILHCYCV